MVIQVYDTLSGRQKPLETVEPGRVRAYVCGITPYDSPHVGYARLLVVWDIIRRHLERRGYNVTVVQNVTDIEDRLIERARERHTTPNDLADVYTAKCFTLMEALGVAPPDYMPRATDHIRDIHMVIGRLIAEGLAYAAPDGVYFRVRSFPGYGRLSHRDPDEMASGVRVEPEPGKEDPLDFALWKAERPGEPVWTSPWGPGRPGWHVECSAMAWRYLGPVVDLHGGGMDLVFPHHENERAQSEAAFGVSPHVLQWLHHGLIMTDGVKMSKSLGNAEDVGELLKGYGGVVLRGYLSTAHYRSPMEFSRGGIEEFQRAWRRIERLWESVQSAEPARATLEGPLGPALTNYPEELLGALDQDFNTARAWAVTFEMARAAQTVLHGGSSAETAAAAGLTRRNLEVFRQAFGLNPGEQGAAPDPPEDVREWAREREAARARREWALADALRARIQDAGWKVEDSADGSRLRALERATTVELEAEPEGERTR